MPSDAPRLRAFMPAHHDDGRRAHVVSPTTPRGSSARITEFAQGTSRWLVAVRMVSEGVDAPRLSVGAYVTAAVLAQAIGRFVRSRRLRNRVSIFSCRRCPTSPQRWPALSVGRGWADRNGPRSPRW